MSPRKAKDSKDNESLAQKIKRSPDVSTAISKLSSTSGEGESISLLEKTPSPLVTSSRTRRTSQEQKWSSSKKVKGSPLINVSESHAKKTKKIGTVPTVQRKLEFASGEERILPFKESRTPLDSSIGISETALVKVKESPVENLNENPAKKSERSHNASAAVSKVNFTSEEDESMLPLENIEDLLDSPTEIVKTISDLHNENTPGKKEKGQSGETLVSQDLLKDGVFTDSAGLCTFPEEESRVFQNILPDLSNATSDSHDFSTGMRKLTLWSGGKMTYAEEEVINSPFDEPVKCFYCRRKNIAHSPLLKYMLDCPQHEGVGACQPEMDMEKCLETSQAQLLDLKYLSLQYQCFMCFCIFYDLRNFKCHLKCSHCLSYVILCQKCFPLFL